MQRTSLVNSVCGVLVCVCVCVHSHVSHPEIANTSDKTKCSVHQGKEHPLNCTLTCRRGLTRSDILETLLTS